MRNATWQLLTDDPEPTPGFARELVLAAVLSIRRREASSALNLQFAHSLPWPLLVEVCEDLLLSSVAASWSGGWQPAELHRQARLGCRNAGAAKLAGWAMATDHLNRRSSIMDGRWLIQVEDLELPSVGDGAGWLQQWVDTELLPTDEALELIVELLVNLTSLPRLERILPPPGESDVDEGVHRLAGGPARGTAGDPVLERIRNLLAKAESTAFEAEAMAFTAKAHELMTRHAIDAVALDQEHRGAHERPVIRRVFIDAPYVETKSYLLQVVAEAGRCRAFLYSGLALSSIVGFADDVAAVEVLFTSLLLQAQRGLAQAAKQAPPGASPNSKAFRTSFLTGFSHRIAERLRQVNEEVLAAAEADHGASLVPLLQSREEEVDEFMGSFDLVTRSSRRRSLDGSGYMTGQAAADRAQLTGGYLAR